MLHRIDREIAGTEHPWIIRDSDWGGIRCLHAFRAVCGRTVAVIDIRFERGEREHVVRVHESLERFRTVS